MQTNETAMVRLPLVVYEKARDSVGFFELFFIGIGLSMDAFAVAICKGLGMKRIDYGQAFVIAFAFGFFQALMPLIGWLLGASFEYYITPIDHWIAFFLLAFIGGKMLYDGIRGEDEAAYDEASEDGDDGDDGDDRDNGDDRHGRDGKSSTVSKPRLDLRELLMLAIATSIDALAVGITFAFLGVNIWIAITIIGITTFCLSFIGVVIGNQFGSRFERPASIIGGCVLILIGLKILLEHLGIIG